MHRDSCSPSVNPRGCNPHRFSYQHSVHLKRMLKQVDTYYEFVTAFYTFYLNVPFETWTLLVQINRKIAEKFRNFGNFFLFPKVLKNLTSLFNEGKNIQCCQTTKPLENLRAFLRPYTFNFFERDTKNIKMSPNMCSKSPIFPFLPS